MKWQTPTFTRIPVGTELGYTNELDPPVPVSARPPRRPAPARRTG